MENPPSGEKPLKSVPFIAHLTRGVIRDQTVRRKAMFIIMVVALVMLFAGFTFLAPALNPREHLMRALLFWFACAWLTLTAMLLALFDLLMVRAQARREQRALREEFSSQRNANARGSEADDGVNSA